MTTNTTPAALLAAILATEAHAETDAVAVALGERGDHNLSCCADAVASFVDNSVCDGGDPTAAEILSGARELQGSLCRCDDAQPHVIRALSGVRAQF